MSQPVSKCPSAPRLRPVTQPIEIPKRTVKRSSEVSDFSKYISPKPNYDNATRYFLTRQSMPPEYQSYALDQYFRSLEQSRLSPIPERKTESAPQAQEMEQVVMTYSLKA